MLLPIASLRGERHDPPDPRMRPGRPAIANADTVPSRRPETSTRTRCRNSTPQLTRSQPSSSSSPLWRSASRTSRRSTERSQPRGPSSDRSRNRTQQASADRGGQRPSSSIFATRAPMRRRARRRHHRGRNESHGGNRRARRVRRSRDRAQAKEADFEARREVDRETAPSGSDRTGDAGNRPNVVEAADSDAFARHRQAEMH